MLKFIFLILTTIFSVFCEGPIVTLPNGKVRGISVTPPLTIDLTYYAFLGIPFAAPPVGALRFKPPHPVDDWDGILEANNSHRSCYQVDKEDQYETEDCLYLNVYTPLELPPTRKLPVLVFIYGGTFVHGHSNYNPNTPAFLMLERVIYVSFNYRVGPIGFLSTGDTVIPGNMGLKDQQFVLKWVQQNIHLFGGDPEQVTIMGQSAGAASVTYHLLSPGSSGLFRAAIANSGTALCDWAYQRNAVDTAYGIAAEIDPNFTKDRSTKELLDLLLTVDASLIDGTSYKYKVFAPVVEVPHDGAFISSLMYDSLEQGNFTKVPILMGFNSEESIGMARDIDAWKKHVQRYDEDPSTLVNDDMYIIDSDKKLTVGKEIRNIYVGDGLFADNLGKAIQYYGDNRFIRPIIKFAELISLHTSDIFFYQFSYHGELGGNNVSLPGIGRVAHAEDQRYFWAEHDSMDEYPKSDLRTAKVYIKFLTNFIRYLKPTPYSDYIFKNSLWVNITSHYFSYMDIDEELKVYQNPRNFSYGKWVDIFEKYVEKPFISY